MASMLMRAKVDDPSALGNPLHPAHVMSASISNAKPATNVMSPMRSLSPFLEFGLKLCKVTYSMYEAIS
jgi:hypothetical protein